MGGVPGCEAGAEVILADSLTALDRETLGNTKEVP